MSYYKSKHSGEKIDLAIDEFDKLRVGDLIDYIIKLETMLGIGENGDVTLSNNTSQILMTNNGTEDTLHVNSLDVLNQFSMGDFYVTVSKSGNLELHKEVK